MSLRQSRTRFAILTIALFAIASLALGLTASGNLNLFGSAATEAKAAKAAPAMEKGRVEALVPLSGTYNIPGDFADLATAITTLNTEGVGGPVILNLVAANPQTAPAGGYIIGGAGTALLTTTTSTNNVTIQGNGNTITASPALTIGVLHDSIFELVGADWITITGFSMTENALNVATAPASNTMTEFGVSLFYATTIDGAQNNTITGNTIDLNRNYVNTFGIYSNSTHTSTTITTSATATGAAGGNDNLKVYTNNITDVNFGIVHVGPTAAADQNPTVDIGGVAAGTGNNINNFGTTTTSLSGYANVSGTINGILVRNTKNFNISFNTIASSNGGILVGTTNGIQIPASSNAPTGTLTQTINNNNISIRPGASVTVVGITMPSGSVNATTTNSINNNDFNTFGHTVAATSAITFISQGGNPLTQNMNNNTFTNMSVNTTGTITFFSFAPNLISGASFSLSGNNIVTGFTRTGIGATTVWSSNASSVAGSSHAINTNNFSNITLTGASAFTGISDTDGLSTSAPVRSVNGNTFNNIVTGAGTVAPITVNFGAPASTVNNNTISNITTGNSITCLTLGSSNQATITASGNLIDPINSAGASVIGISVAGIGAVVSKNKIYDLNGTAAASVVTGIANVGSTTSSTITIVNNLVGNLTAPIATSANGVIGISTTSTALTSNFNVYYNTVYVNNTTSGAGFGSSGISALASATATSSTLNLRNNIIVNTSVQNGAGLTVAYRRSLGTAGALANYASTSNNNDFYAGTPSATNLIYADGTSTATTIAAYKGGVFTAGTIAPRDNASFSENPPFLSTTGSSANFLHINPATPTQIESGAAPIAGITDDFDGNVRSVSTPDVGADEGSFTLLDLAAPIITYTALGNTSSTTNRTLTATIADATGVATGALRPRIYFKKSTDGTYVSTQCTMTGGTAQNGTYDCVIDYTLVGGGSVVAGDTIQYFVVAQDTLGNVGANPGGGFAATDVNTVTTPPTTPNSYLIIPPPLAGDYTVGIAPFARITGKTITFETRTRTVLHDVELSSTKADEANGGDAKTAANEPDRSKKPTAVVTADQMVSPATAKIAVQETYSVVLLDGVEPSGVMYHEFTAEDRETFGIEDNLVGVYPTVTAAVADYNLRGVSAHTRFLLTDASYTTGLGEAFPIVASTTSSAGPSATATLTIQPNTGITSTISGVSASGIIVFGDPFLKIDGDNVGGDVARNLTINNTGTGASSYVVGFFNLGGTKVARNGTVRYTNIRGGVTAVATVSWGIILNGVGGDYDDALIENNKIWQSLVGIGHYGVAATGINNNGIIRNNIIGDATGSAESIKQRGIEISNSDGLSVTGNEVFGNAAGNSNSAQIGIGLFTAGASNITISRNLIHDFFYNGTGGFGCFGVYVGVNAGTTNITNNMIYNIKGDGDVFSTSTNSLTFIPIGIAVDANSGTLNVDFNSVYMQGATLTAAFTGQSAAFATRSGLTGINLRNNALRNSMTTVGAPVAGNKTYAVAQITPGAATTTFGTINNNDYFVNGVNPNVGYTASLDRGTLAAWQAATAQDTASLSVDPLFISNTDLHLQTLPVLSPLVAAGATLAGVTVDYDLDTRPATGNPDIGADELVQAEGGTIPAGTYYNVYAVDNNLIGGPTRVTNSLTLTGVLSGNLSRMTLGCNASVFGASATNYFTLGDFEKEYCAPGAFSFPVGATGYSPVGVTVTAGTFPPTALAPPSLTIRAFNAPFAPFTPATAVNRNWALTESGDLTADLVFNYLEADTASPGVDTDETDYRLWRRDTAAPTEVCGVGCVDEVLNTASVTGQTSFSRWGIAGAPAPTASAASLSGRVLTPDGRGIRNVTMTIEGGNLTERRYVRTSSFGWFTFDELRAGETYVVTVNSRRYWFQLPSRVITLTSSVSDVDFIAEQP